MRVLKENEVQAISGGVTFAEIGGKLIGDGAPEGVKSVIGALASPFILILGFVLLRNTG